MYSGCVEMLCLAGFVLLITQGHVTALPACESEVWCKGPLLQTVQNSRIYKDSKTFVDMNLKYDPEVVLSAFANLSNGGAPRKDEVRHFLQTYFEGPDEEFESWTPTDYTDSPAFLTKVKDAELRKFGKSLCQKWQHLGRKIKSDVKLHQDKYSLIYMDHPFIVPGGRFRETYYWDSYWVIKGLLACEMKQTVKGMLLNFMSLVQRYGMVPNGNRKYYTRRSQPPFLIPMVDLYIKATGDMTFLRDNMPFLAEEYKFWMTNRSVQYNNVVLNRYAAPITEPRPESYREDIATQQMATDLPVPDERLFQSLASAAESGWDFSSRWFSRDFQNLSSDVTTWLKYIDTIDVIPVDLNSVLCLNEMLLASFYDKLGDHNSSSYYKSQQSVRQAAMMDLFWDDKEGSWFDLSFSSKSRRTRFFPSNVFPLYVSCRDNRTNLGQQVMNYLKRKDVLHFESGVPTSLLETSQQWDFPNAWPPLQDAMVTALMNTDLDEGRQAGLDLVSDWIESNYIGWKKTNNMFEKYVVTEKGSRGGGGEYDVQEGFGWTNGVVLDFLDRFGEELSLDSTSNAGNGSHLPPRLVFTTLVLTLILFCFTYTITRYILL